MSKKNRGFTLIETVVAVFLLTVGTAGAFVLIQKTVAFTSASSSQLIAAYLAQEGVEIVRNIRDSNYLEKESWDSGLTGCDNGCEADYNDIALVPISDGEARFLTIDSNLYSYEGEIDSPYKRKITITPQDGALNVLVEVSWQERGAFYQVPVQTKLYDWR